MYFKDETGKRFGRLIVKEFLGKGRWLCLCDCGNKCTPRSDSLRRGTTKSCGCLGIEKRSQKTTKHGKSKSRTYSIWKDMKYRCDNPKLTNYKYYGGRNISYCVEWKDFEKFLADMGEAPEKMTLDRIDNCKDYFKENCRWSSMKTQSRNKRTTIKVKMDGEIRSLVEWCEILDMKYKLVYSRIYYGWDPIPALKTPKGQGKIKTKLKGDI